MESQKFVNSVFRDLMLRPAKPAELAYWAHLLDKGVPREALVGQVQRLEIHRYQQVRRLFTGLLARMPNDAEMKLYGGELLAGRTVEHVTAEIMALDEYFAGPGGGTNDGFIDAVFLYATGVVPDAEEHAAFVTLLNKNSRQRVARLILNTEPTYIHNSTTWYLRLCREPISRAELAVCVSMFLADEREETVIANMMASDEYYQFAQTR